MPQTLDLYLAPYGTKDGVVNKANPTQEKVLEWVDKVRHAPLDLDHIPVLYIQGGVGCGKTRAFMAAVLELLTEIPGLNLLWGRHDFKDLKLSIMNKFFEILPVELIAGRNETYHWYDIETPDNPSRIFFNGLKDLTGLGSQEFAVIVINEVHEISEQIYRALKRRCRQEGKPIMILMEGEAPNEGHWLSRLTNPTNKDFDPDIEMWTASTYENWDNLPAAYKGSLERMPESWKSKYLYGRFGFIPDGTPFYAGFVERIHKYELQWNPHKELLVGWDFGFHHPAIVVTQIDHMDRWLWLHEILGNDVTIDIFADKVMQDINRNFPGARCLHFGDPACIQKNDKSESTTFQILLSKGIHINYKPSEYRLRKEIIEKKLATLIDGKPMLLVDESCRIAIDGFLGGYHYPLYDTKKSFIDKYEAPFRDGYYEHIMNAGEYVAIHLFSPITPKQQYRNQTRKVISADNI